MLRVRGRYNEFFFLNQKVGGDVRDLVYERASYCFFWVWDVTGEGGAAVWGRGGWVPVVRHVFVSRDFV